MRGTDKALPWVMSVGIHGVVLLIPLSIIVVPALRPASPRGVEISLVEGFGRAGPSGTREVRASAPAASAAAPTLRQSGVFKSAASVAAGRPARVAPLMERPTMDSSSSMPLPSEQDVLSDLAALKPQASDGTSAAAAITLSQGAQIGWEGAQRKLLRRRDPEFPPLLSAIGQEIEGEARITVAASGAVVRVEITRSSGYIEIDASVEAALRDYLFSRADGRENAIGTVRFRFRLEKLD